MPKSLIVRAAGGVRINMRVKPHMKISHLLDEPALKKQMTNPADYYCIVHNRKILPRHVLLDGDLFVDGEEVRLVGRKPYIGYVRLSTRKQIKEYGFAAQKEAIGRYVLESNGVVVHYYEEIGSAKTMRDRPVLKKALEACKAEGYTLVTAKVDRLCRSVDQIVDLERASVSFEIAELGADQSRFILFINASVAQEESRMISERTAKAMAEMRVRKTDLESGGLAESGLAGSGLAESGLAESGLAESGLAESGAPETCGLESLESGVSGKHGSAAASAADYWRAHPTAALAAVVRELAANGIANPDTCREYTYTECHKLFGGSRRQKAPPPGELVAAFVKRLYLHWYEHGYCSSSDDDNVTTNDVIICAPAVDLGSDAAGWVEYVEKHRTLVVDELVHIPLNSRLLEKCWNVKIIARDIPNANALAYYRALVYLLPPEGQMRQRASSDATFFELTPTVRSVTSDTIDIVHALYGAVPLSTLVDRAKLSKSTVINIARTTIPSAEVRELQRIQNIQNIQRTQQTR